MNIPAVLKRQTVTQAAVLIAILATFTKIIGLLREVLVAKYFGTSGITDAFIISMLIPGSLLSIIGGAANILIIPYYLEKKSLRHEETKKFIVSVTIFWGISLTIISSIIFLFSPQFIKIIAPGFTKETFELSVILTRYLIFSGFFTIMIGFFTGIFQAEGQFLIPAFMALLANTLLILSLVIFHHDLGVFSWTLGQLLYVIIPFILFIISLRKFIFPINHNILFIIRDNQAFKFTLSVFSIAISSNISLLNLIIDKLSASNQGKGTIAALNFSQEILFIPISIIFSSIVTAIFPTFSNLALNISSQKKQYEDKLYRALSISFYIAIPFTLFMYFLNQPIIKLIFERGAFNSYSTQLTGSLLKMYSIGLFAHAVTLILIRIFYSFKNTSFPLYISLISCTLNLIANSFLTKYFGAPGIALSTSIIMILSFFLYSISLKKYLNPIPIKLISEIFKILLSSIPLGYICYLCQPLFHDETASSLHAFISLTIKVAAVGLASVIPFFALSSLFKLDSFAFLKSYAISSLKKLTQK